MNGNLYTPVLANAGGTDRLSFPIAEKPFKDPDRAARYGQAVLRRLADNGLTSTVVTVWEHAPDESYEDGCPVKQVCPLPARPPVPPAPEPVADADLPAAGAPERQAIRAGLRLLQLTLTGRELDRKEMRRILTDDGDVAPLDVEGIDRLCARLG